MKTFVFDLDGTLLNTEGGNYASSIPISKRVYILTELYKSGNTIVIQTARAKHWEEFTKRQLEVFDIPYHVLSVGAKIWGDVYIDDKGINDKDFFQ